MTDPNPIAALWHRVWTQTALISALAGLVLVIFLAPRFTALAGILVIGTAASRATAAEWRRLRLDTPVILLAALGIFAMISGFWAPEPSGALAKGAILAGLVLATGLAIAALEIIEQKTLHQARGLMGIAIVLGTVIVAVEILTDQWLYRLVVSAVAQIVEVKNKHIHFEGGIAVHAGEGEINRRTTVAVALLLPGLLLVRTIANPAWRRGFITVGIAAGITILVAAWHQSSQAAILAGILTLVLASVTVVWTRRLLLVAWFTAVVLIVPLIIGAFNSDLHRAKWLFYTARHRIVIWDFMATRVLKAPILGIGVEGARVRHETVDREALVTHQQSNGVGVSTAPHAHNFYLQVWYELGAVGAVLSLLAGVTLLSRLSRWPGGVQKWTLAQFAVIGTLIAFSYGLWQTWLQVLIALSVFLTAASLRFGRSDLPIPSGLTTRSSPPD